MKLIKNDLYLLLIDEKAEISKIGTLIYENNTNLINITGADYEPQGMDSKIIAYYPLTEESKELDLPLLPVTPRNKWGVHETHCCSKHGCKYGDNDCCVALGITKQRYPCEDCNDEEQEFSLEDIKKAIEMAQTPIETGIGDHYPNISEIIQQIQQSKLPKGFEPEYEPEYWGARNIFNPNSIDFKVFNEKEKEKYLGVMFDYHPKKLKTIINSKGKEELVGNYKY